MNDGRRVFIALDLPAQLRERIAEIPGALQASGARVRWVEADKMHLTLLFAGEASDVQVQALAEAVEKEEGQKALRLGVGGLGAFPNRRNPRVIWVGVRVSEELESLHGRLQEAGRRCGIELEERSFRPHLTLGRVKFVERHSPLIARLKSVNVETFNYIFDTLTLFESRLTPEGPIYEVLERVELQGR